TRSAGIRYACRRSVRSGMRRARPRQPVGLVRVLILITAAATKCDRVRIVRPERRSGRRGVLDLRLLSSSIEESIEAGDALQGHHVITTRAGPTSGPGAADRDGSQADPTPGGVSHLVTRPIAHHQTKWNERARLE